MTVEERRIEILRGLGSVLRDRHVTSLTMQDIADRLGMAKGNLYYYFKSKQDILFQCHLKATEDSLRLLDDVMGMEDTASGKLDALIKGLVLSVISDPYGAVVTTDMSVLTKSQRSRYVGLRDRFELGVRRLIHEGIAGGEFRSVDVKLCAFAILGAINAVAQWYDSAGERGPDAIAAEFAGLFVRGLREGGQRE
jgi:AcrR family transcriptional regulator